MPEAQIILSQAVIYVATAPKSNTAVCAIGEAMEAVKEQRAMPVPPHLQDSHYRGSTDLGRGIGYKYAHDYPNHYIKQQYLPDGMEERTFYHPTDNGYEKNIKEYMIFLRQWCELVLFFFEKSLYNIRIWVGGAIAMLPP